MTINLPSVVSFTCAASEKRNESLRKDDNEKIRFKQKITIITHYILLPATTKKLVEVTSCSASEEARNVSSK